MFFFVGLEEGMIYFCYWYDCVGVKVGVDVRVSYKGYVVLVMLVDFYFFKGLVDLGDLVLFVSLDWSVKFWKVRVLVVIFVVVVVLGFVVGIELQVMLLLDFVREDVVYDVVWLLVKLGVFFFVDGVGWLELWDIIVEMEELVVRISLSVRKDGRMMLSKSLNKVVWELLEGKRLVIGGIDGQVMVFEVGLDLGGKENLRNEEWMSVKKLVNRIEVVGVNGVIVV